MATSPPDDSGDDPTPNGLRWKLAAFVFGLAFWAVVVWLVFFK
jgi:hypothetical protein